MLAMISASKGDKEILALMLENGVSPNFTQGYSLLVWAVRKEHPECVSYLLQQKADPYSKDKSGKHAIDYARAIGNKQIVNILEENKILNVAQIQSEIANSQDEGIEYNKTNIPLTVPENYSLKNCLWPSSGNERDIIGLMCRTSFLVTFCIAFLILFFCYFILTTDDAFASSATGYIIPVSAFLNMAFLLRFFRVLPAKKFLFDNHMEVKLLLISLVIFALLPPVMMAIERALSSHNELSLPTLLLMLVYAYLAAMWSMAVVRATTFKR